MNKQHAELFATLHHLVSTVTTVFEVLADAKSEDRRGDAPAGSPEPTPRPSEPPPPEPTRDDLCIACGRVCEVMAARVKHGRVCMVCISDSVDDLRRQSERSRLAKIADDIDAQLETLETLADEAIDSDGARSLPILKREVTRLCDLFRVRQGPFANTSDHTDADQSKQSSSRRETEPA